MPTGREDARCGNTGRKSKTKKCERPNPTSNTTAPQPRSIELSEEQVQALDIITHGLSDPDRQVMLVEGYAGVGKTSLAARLPHIYPGRVAFSAPTGKASAVMRSRGCPEAT